MGVSRMTLLYGSAAVMVASFILSSTFNDLWLGANYNKGVETVKIGHDCVSNGYTKWQFVGLLVSVYLYPAAAIAMAVFMSAVYNNIELSKVGYKYENTVGFMWSINSQQDQSCRNAYIVNESVSVSQSCAVSL